MSSPRLRVMCIFIAPSGDWDGPIGELGDCPCHPHAGLFRPRSEFAHEAFRDADGICGRRLRHTGSSEKCCEMCHDAKFAQSEPTGKQNVRFKRLAESAAPCDTSAMGINLKELRKERGWNQQELADRLSVSKSHVSEMEAGIKNPSTPLLERMSSVFEIPMRDLFGRDAEAVVLAPGIPASDSPDLIPVYSVQASAGPGSFVTDEEIVDRLAFPRGYLQHITKSHPRHLKIIKCRGDSMSPTLKDDDVVMVDTSKTDLSFEGLFVIKVDGGAALLVKRIGRASRRGYINLISDNPSHPAVEIVGEDVIPVGKVVWAGVKV